MMVFNIKLIQGSPKTFYSFTLKAQDRATLKALLVNGQHSANKLKKFKSNFVLVFKPLNKKIKQSCHNFNCPELKKPSAFEFEKNLRKIYRLVSQVLKNSSCKNIHSDCLWIKEILRKYIDTQKYFKKNSRYRDYF